MGGRGGYEPGGGMPGEQFASMTRASAVSHDFELSELQQMILDAAIENGIITRSEFEAILADGDMAIEDLISELEDELNEKLKSKPSRRIRSKTHTKVLAGAIAFWKRHHGGKIPVDAQEKFSLPEIQAIYFDGPRNFTPAEWSYLTFGLGAFGHWLDLVYAAAIAGRPMPSDF